MLACEATYMQSVLYTGFELGILQLRKAIYFSIIAITPFNFILIFSWHKASCKTHTKKHEFHLYCWNHVCKVNDWCLVYCFNHKFRVSAQKLQNFPHLVNFSESFGPFFLFKVLALIQTLIYNIKYKVLFYFVYLVNQTRTETHITKVLWLGL